MKAIKYLFLLFCLVGTQVMAQRGTEEYKALNSPPEEDKYHIFFKGKHVGTYDVKKEQEGTRTIYTSLSESSIKVFGTITVTYKLKSVYQGNKLIESHVIAYRNGKVTDDTKTVWKGNAYEIIYNGDKLTYSEPITRSSIVMYFEPPVNRDKVYSERDGAVKTASSSGSNSFVLKDDDGNVGSTFFYKNNRIDRVEVPFVMGQFTIKHNAQ